MNTLLLPGSLWPLDAGAEPYAGLPRSPLTQALARGQVDRCEARCWSSALCFELTGQHQDAPFAALMAHSLGLAAAHPDATTWLRADPAHFEVGREDVALATPPDFALSAQEAEALVSTLNAHFEQEGIRLYAASPRQWLLATPHALEVRTIDPWAALHVPARFLHYDGAGARALRKFTTEAQMLLHDHPVNRAREARGEPRVNALWCWASGRLDRSLYVPTAQRLCTHCKQAHALGQWLGVSSSLVTESPPAAASCAERKVGYFPDAMAALLEGDGERWRAQFAAMASVFGGFEGAPVRIILGGQRPTHCVTVSPRPGAWARWRERWFGGEDPGVVLHRIATHGT